MSTILVALGGNAILQPGQRGTYEEQLQNVQICSEKLAELVGEGYKLVVTHGNGPQVGNLLIQQERATDLTPSLPLHTCVAQTQGQIGLLLQLCLDNALGSQGLNVQSTALVTRTLVDGDDAAFKQPTKPVGPFFSEEYAQARMKLGETWIDDSKRGWRRVVPSPQPKKILELESIKCLLKQHKVVIAVGGGGIPVIEQENQIVGVDAVIDKDLASSLLAQELKLETFVILTDVESVKLNFGQAQETSISCLSVDTAEKYLCEGQFAVGSMAPKIQGAINFVKAGGKRALITSFEQLKPALQGKAGTVIRQN